MSNNITKNNYKTLEKKNIILISQMFLELYILYMEKLLSKEHYIEIRIILKNIIVL